MMLARTLKSADASSAAARAAVEAAKAEASKYGLRRVLDNGEPRCLFATRGDECRVTIVNVGAYADAFRAAGFAEDRNYDAPAFVFEPERMAEAAAIVKRA